MSECPVCGGGVSAPSEAIISELVDCGGCASELEVINLSPLSLRLAPMEDEDWGE